MLFAHAVFNVFTGVLDVTNCIERVLNDVRQNVAAVLLFLYLLFGTNNVCVVPYGVMRNLDAIIRVRMVLCETRCYYSFRIIEYRNNKTAAIFWRTSLRTRSIQFVTSKTPVKILKTAWANSIIKLQT